MIVIVIVMVLVIVKVEHCVQEAEMYDYCELEV